MRTSGRGSGNENRFDDTAERQIQLELLGGLHIDRSQAPRLTSITDYPGAVRYLDNTGVGVDVYLSQLDSGTRRQIDVCELVGVVIVDDDGGEVRSHER